jgi:hypothetical protein
MDMRFCTWNVRNFYRGSSFTTVAKKLAKYQVLWVYRWLDEPAADYKFLCGNR